MARVMLRRRIGVLRRAPLWQSDSAAGHRDPPHRLTCILLNISRTAKSVERNECSGVAGQRDELCETGIAVRGGSQTGYCRRDLRTRKSSIFTIPTVLTSQNLIDPSSSRSDMNFRFT